MPTLRQLEYLVALEERRHFRRAAESCGVSQPTLSAQLKALEERLSSQLVERSHAHVILTPAGKEVATLARRVLRDVEEIRYVAARTTSGLGGTIRIGLALTLGPYLLPRMIADLHANFTDLKLYVREDYPDMLPRDLEQGRHDVCVLPLPINRDEIASMAIFREPIYLAMSVDHPLAQKRRVDRRDLRGQSILTLEPGHRLREQVETICKDVGARLMPDYEGTSLDTLREMVGMNMGLTFLPGLYIRSSMGQDDAIRTVQLSGRPITRTIGLIWRKSSARIEDYRRLAEEFRNAIRRDFPDFMLLS